MTTPDPAPWGGAVPGPGADGHAGAPAGAGTPGISEGSGTPGPGHHPGGTAPGAVPGAAWAGPTGTAATTASGAPTGPGATAGAGAGVGAAAAADDVVVAHLGGLGAPVDHSGSRSLDLGGPQTLWLVTYGAMDLFAVDAGQEGHWHFLGRLETGTLLLGPSGGPRHTLVGRPLQGCALRRIQLRELLPGYGAPAAGAGSPYGPYGGHTAYGDSPETYPGAGPAGQGGWYQDSYGAWHPHGDAAGAAQGGSWTHPGHEPALSPLDDAFARGYGRSLRVLFEAPFGEQHPTLGADGAGAPGDGGAPDGGAGPAAGEPEFGDENILWMSLTPGSVQYGSVYGAETAAELLIDGSLWQTMVNQQVRLLTALDRWIERLERAHEDRTAAGLRAGEAERERADRALLASIGRPRRRSTLPGPPGAVSTSDDATLAVCHRVAAAARIPVAAPGDAGGSGAGARLDPVERVALASRFRTRDIRLGGAWWRENTGPLVGRWADDGSPVALLWRRGRYEAVDADGTRERLGGDNAGDLEPRAVMFYRPLPDRPQPAWRLLLFALRGTRVDLRNLALGGLVAVALGALVPVATGKVLGEFVPAAETGLIVQTSLALIVGAVLAAAFLLLQNISILRMEGRVEATLQPAVWDRLLRLPTRFFAERSTGELASAAMGISAIRRVLSGISSTVLQAGTMGGVSLVLLLVYSVPLALVALSLLTVIAAVFLALGLWQLRYQRRLVVLTNKLNNQAFQTLRGLPKLRVAAAESFAYAAWAGEFARSRELQQRVGRVKNLITVLNAVALPLSLLTLFMLLAGPARGALSPSGFLTFNTAVTMMLGAVTQLTGALISAAAVLPMFEQVRPVFQAVPEVRGGSTRPGELSGAIEARRLSFRYSGDGPLVLDGVSFRVEPGEFVAIVGASGCGKSTLLRLLIGFDRPDAGEVLYDGQDLAALDQAAVRLQCGVVLQNSQPFSGSVLDCIRGTGTYTLEEAWEAARLAGLAEDIRRMPMGMHTVLSDGGGTVSGGQRQRLMIAQALIRRPRILFFDEATSALDNETQRVVTESTRALNATRVVIAHRLSTVMDADRIVVMDAGRVVQEGPPATLLADTTGLFHELVRRQIH
ncbi:NHLP bacteriocin export ABC transporter permease/ATPase subunit [Streptomyces zingiberis]|uniref:NHLP bacteriocin export ABC transporter permease/ATPase subunit n=1 Tax=Streptomyces zingiberis TaxID=2053010 RepID=A0ABX1BYH9_9ACTN|nr:NHLP bacteriocin export ABC transporter permease/ATPase subunit [Streptomyces zingiberis]NJQ02691.1 NHLP bacteriocin export ABC transporter permease/ATPase subunit [Streptomyces zingiberis]